MDKLFSVRCFYLISSLVLLVSCSPSYSSLMNGGMVKAVSFVEIIPFDFDKKLPIIDVVIENRTYQFLFDTGAPNVISKELSQKIKFNKGSSAKINDSQGASNKQISVQIPLIQIGNIEFEDFGAVVIDYNKTFELSCYSFDGIIGANLMSKLCWKIDYKNHEITFSDHISSLDIPESCTQIPFTIKGSQKTPEVAVQIGETRASHLTFDTGATGSFSLKKSIFKEEYQDFPKISSFGTSSVGVYGSGQPDESIYALVDTLKIADIMLFNQVVEFDNSSDLIGNRFLKNYDIYLDWNGKEIHLNEVTSFQDTSIIDFGFKPRVIDNQLFVSSIINDSKAKDLGLQLNDQIIKIDDENYEFISDEDACNMLFTKLLEDKDEITIQVVRGEKQLIFNLQKELLLN